MFTFATIHSGLSWGYLVSSFKFHGGNPSIATALTVNAVWYKALGDSSFCITILIADCLFVSFVFLNLLEVFL